MKLAFDARHLSFPYSGLGRFTSKLLEATLDLPGFSSFNIILDKNTRLDPHLITKIESRRAVVVRLDAPLKGFRHHWTVSRWVNRSRADLYFYPHFDLPLLVNRPSRFVILDLLPLIFDGYIQNFTLLKKLFFWLAIRINAAKGHAIYPLSEATKRDLLEKVLPKNFSQPLPVCYGGPSLEEENSEETPHSAPYLLYVGDRRPHKNLRMTIDLFRQLKKQSLYAGDLVIVGSTKNYDFDLDSYIAGDSSIFIHGNCPESKLPSYYRHADALLFLSLYEGLGFPVLDAALLGKKIITTARGSLSEVAPPWSLILDTSCSPKDLAQSVSDYLRLDITPALTPEYHSKFSWKSAAQIIFATD